MIRALIFDFNGVLADDDPIHMEAFRQVASEEGLSFTDDEYLDKYLPLNDRDCFTMLFRESARSLPQARLDELIRRKSDY
jgi:beta-phosphoglucomutase